MAFILSYLPHALGQTKDAPARAGSSTLAPAPAAAKPPAAATDVAPAADKAVQSGGSVKLPDAAQPAQTPQPDESKQGMFGPKGEELVYLNVQGQDISDVIRQISKATGKNFIIDDKIKGKVTILSEKKMTKEEAYQAFLSALEVAGFTTVIGPGGIIKIVSTKDAASSPIPTHVDSTPYTDSYVTRLISLKNISALDMSSAIKGLVSKNGNMFAYPSTNTLILTDSGTNIDRLMKIIKELDQEGPQQVLEIIPIHYADARDVAQKVVSLFELEQAGRTTAAPKRAGAAGAELAEIKDVSKIIADERTNALIVLASKRAIDQVRDIIAKLDRPLDTADTGTIHVHYLKYANAKDMASTLSSITSGAGKQTGGKTTGAPKTAAQKEGEAGNVVAQLEGGVTLGADESTNALIITASSKDYKTLVDELISKLDIPRRQVYLEAIVMELEVEKGTKAGVSGYSGVGTSSIMGFGSTSFDDPSFSAIKGLFSPQGFFGTPGLLGGLLSRDSVTINVPNAGGTGTQEITIPSFAAFLNFLQTYRDANIVSSPNILTLDNQKASIEVTHIRYATKTTQSGTTGFQSIEPYPLEAGLTLEITPQISEGDAVRLEIHHKLSNFTGPGNTASGNAPPQTKREITTTVMAMDGQTVVLGGLMEDQVTHGRSKVPLLGDIPLLGFLFKSTSSGIIKNNLLVFITPHVIRDPSDFANISKTKIEQRNKFIEQNYGKKQRQSIYDTIATHRADLLEYTEPSASSKSLEPMPSSSPQLTSSAAPTAKTTPSAQKSAPAPKPAPSPKSAPPPSPPPSQTKQPVITTPALGTQSSLEKKSDSSAPMAAAAGSAKAKSTTGNLDLSY